MSAGQTAAGQGLPPLTPQPVSSGLYDGLNVSMLVAEAVRQQVSLIGALPKDQQHELLGERLQALQGSGALSPQEATALQDKATGAPTAAAPSPLAGPTTAPLTLVQVLDAAIPAGVAHPGSHPTPEFSLGGIITAICTATGAVLGGIMGGPVGAVVGASIGYGVGRTAVQ